MKILSLLRRPLLLMAALLACSAAMAEYAGPAITSFYPGQSDPYQVMKPNAKLYTYFGGNTIIYNKAQIVQDGEVIGTITYDGSSAGVSTTTMNPAKDYNQDINLIQPGAFTIQVYEVQYLAVKGDPESVVTFSDPASPLASVTYQFNGNAATITSVSHFADNTVYSYIPAGGEGGVMSITVSKPLKPECISAELILGNGNFEGLNIVPHTLSDDGKTITVDIRGLCLNPEALAPGYEFKDDEGNPYTPSSIGFQLNGLNCTDGTQVKCDVEKPGGGTYSILGKAFYNYAYVDLTLPNPELTEGVFYNSADPSKTYGSINPATDMMALTVTNSSSLASASVSLKFNEISEIVADADIEKDGDIYRFTLPVSIKAAGSGSLIVGLEDVVYVREDGVEHTIYPLNFERLAADRYTVADLRASNPGETVTLVTEKALVTMANDLGYCFIEDETAGVMVQTASGDDTGLVQGTRISGSISGYYQTGGIFVIDPNASVFTLVPADISQGRIIDSLEGLSDESLDAMLVTVVIPDSAEAMYDEDEGAITVVDGDLAMLAITALIDEFVEPVQYKNLTGVLTLAYGSPMLLMRDMDDINRNLATEPVVESIAELKALYPDVECALILNSAKVIYHHDDYGFAIIDDATGGLQVSTLDFENIFTSGTAVTGTLHGVYDSMSSMFVVDADLSDYSDNEIADITTGHILTVDEINVADHAYRLVTLKASDEQTIEADPDNFGLIVGGKVSVVDMFDVLDWDYEFPATITQVTGFVYPTASLMLDEDDEFDMPEFMIVLRGLSDIVDLPSGIDAITPAGTDADAPAYDLRGIKVNTPARGIYIISGRKVLVK